MTTGSASATNFEQLTQLKNPDSGDVDTFLDKNTFPIVLPGRVIFVYRGDAEQVKLRQWVYGLPADPAMHQLKDTDLWYLESDLPDKSRIEYKFEVTAAGQTSWIIDPLNPNTALDPFGANSVCRGYGYRRPDWTMPKAQVREGTIDQFSMDSSAFADTREVAVYLPARFRAQRSYPLLIVHDGADFLKFAELKTVLDNLIHRLEIAPLIVAFPIPHDRTTEYAADDRHASFIASELLPALEQRYPIDPHVDSRGLMGASFGAVASLHAAWRHPGLFGRLMLLSGSYAFSDIGRHQRGPTFDPVVEFINQFRQEPTTNAQRIYMSCGVYESLIYENRSLLPQLRDSGSLVRYEEARDGHNWENWRDRQQSGLSWLFRGPLWMVYE